MNDTRNDVESKKARKQTAQQKLNNFLIKNLIAHNGLIASLTQGVYLFIHKVDGVT